MKKLIFSVLSILALQANAKSDNSFKLEVTHSYKCKESQADTKVYLLEVVDNRQTVIVDKGTRLDVPPGKSSDVKNNTTGLVYRFFNGQNYFSLNIPMDMVSGNAQSGVVFVGGYSESYKWSCVKTL